MPTDQTLRSISDIRRYFQQNETPTYYIDETSFHLLGIDEWVRGFQYVTYSDPFDGTHPNIITPERTLAGSFPWETLEEMNNFLLRQPQVIEHIRKRGPGRALLLYFNEETLDLCKALDLEVSFPSIALRKHIDSKIETTRIGDRAGVPSVPNVIAHVDSYEDLEPIAKQLGPELVIQTAFGDSGMTTYFVSSREDFDRCHAAVRKEAEVKVMKRIRCRPTAIEGCVTRSGTIVGPLMKELIGFPELTPYRGGWGGNEIGPHLFDADIAQAAHASTKRIGDELAKLGFRGYFEIDYLVDLDANRLYLGEINPRISGASSMTNLSTFGQADVPMFLFHLLEFSGADFDLDVAELNRRWARPEFVDSWSHLVIKHTGTEPHVVGEAPASGVWRMDAEGQIRCVRQQTHRRSVADESEAFLFRVTTKGDLVTPGEDMAVAVLRGRLLTDDNELSDRAKDWISAVRRSFKYRRLGELGPPSSRARPR